MYCTSVTLVLLGTLCATICAVPVGLGDIFAGFQKNANLLSPEKQSQTVKRRVYEENPDSGLKRVSLQALIGDLESGLYQSAASASSAKHEQTPTPGGEHPISKRKADEGTKVALETSTPALPESSEKPHIGADLPGIPAFQVQHTKLISATIKEAGSNATQITITKTNIHTSNVDPATTTDKADSGDKPSTDSSTEKEASTTEAPTKKPSPDDLKKAEAKLNEKVAEIEAEPVILSARV